MKNLQKLVVILALSIINNGFAYEFDFLNLTANKINLYLNTYNCGNLEASDFQSTYCAGNFQVLPGEHVSYKFKGDAVAYCLKEVQVYKESDTTNVLGKPNADILIGKWSGSLCKNQGFRVDDTGIHEGSDVSLHKFTITNPSNIPVDVNAKLLLVDVSRTGKGGLKENKFRLCIPQFGSQPSTVPCVIDFGMDNVYKIVLFQLTNPSNNKISTFFSNSLISKDMNLQVRLNPTSQEIFLTDSDGKQYTSQEALTREAQATQQYVHKKVFGK